MLSLQMCIVTCTLLNGNANLQTGHDTIWPMGFRHSITEHECETPMLLTRPALSYRWIVTGRTTEAVAAK